MSGLSLYWSIWALLAFAVALVCLLWRRSMGSEVRLMASVPTARAADVGTLAPGTLTEVKGMLRCAAPVTAEFSGQACAWFRAVILREDTIYDRDSEGKQRQRTQTTTVHENIQRAPCFVEDASGRVALDLTDATVEGTEAVNQADSMLGASTTRRKENLLAADIPIYVMGEVRADGSIGAPAKGSRHKTFLVSNRSEEQRTKDLSSTISFATWCAAIFAAIATGLLLWAWHKGPV